MRTYNVNDLKSGKQEIPKTHTRGVFASIREELRKHLTKKGEAIFLFDFLKECKAVEDLPSNQRKYNYIENAANGSGKEFKVVKIDGRNFLVKIK